MDNFHKYLSDINPEILQDIYNLKKKKERRKLIFLQSIYILMFLVMIYFLINN